MTAQPVQTARATSSGRRRRRRDVWSPYLLLAPTFILIAAFIAYPVGSVFAFSLQHYNVTQPWNNGFAGLENFQRMFSDGLFWSSLGFTTQWVLVQVALQLVFGLVIALILNETFIGRAVARAVIFAPWAVAGVMTTALFALLYNPDHGFNAILRAFGASGASTAVLANTDTVFWAAVIAELWHGLPFFAVLLLASLQSIPQELYEAASVDGANRWAKFRVITLPHLRSTIIITSLLRMVWEFNNVDLLYTLTGGGPANQTTTLPLYIVRTAINDYNFGYGSALTVAAFVVLLFVSILYLRLTRFGGDER